MNILKYPIALLNWWRNYGREPAAERQARVDAYFLANMVSVKPQEPPSRPIVPPAISAWNILRLGIQDVYVVINISGDRIQLAVGPDGVPFYPTEEQALALRSQLNDGEFESSPVAWLFLGDESFVSQTPGVSCIRVYGDRNHCLLFKTSPLDASVARATIAPDIDPMLRDGAWNESGNVPQEEFLGHINGLFADLLDGASIEA